MAATGKSRSTRTRRTPGLHRTLAEACAETGWQAHALSSCQSFSSGHRDGQTLVLSTVPGDPLSTKKIQRKNASSFSSPPPSLTPPAIAFTRVTRRLARTQSVKAMPLSLDGVVMVSPLPARAVRVSQLCRSRNRPEHPADFRPLGMQPRPTNQTGQRGRAAPNDTFPPPEPQRAVRP